MNRKNPAYAGGMPFAKVETFGKEGDVFVNDYYGGFHPVSAKSQYQLFDNDESQISALLTNLKTARSIEKGQSMTVTQMGIRIFNIGATPPTSQWFHDALRFLNTSKLTVFTGDDKKLGEYILSRMSPTISATTQTVLENAYGNVDSSANIQAWIQLPVAIPLEQLAGFVAKLECNLSGGTPTGIGYVDNDPTTVFHLIYSGFKQRLN